MVSTLLFLYTSTIARYSHRLGVWWCYAVCMINTDPVSIPDQNNQLSPKANKAIDYINPYWDYGYKKSGELGPGSGNYPYTIETCMNGSKIEFNGMKHINNPQDESLLRLEERFRLFISNSNNPIVFVEGGVRQVDDLERDIIVARNGEPGLMCKLAQDSGVPVISPEPNKKYEVQKLLKVFSPEEIMQHYFTRTLAQWYRNKDHDLSQGLAQDYIEKRMAADVKCPGLEHTNTSYDYYADVFALKYGMRPEEMQEEVAKKTLNDEASPNQSVSAYLGLLRDKNIYEQIQKAANDGFDVFIVYGAHHAFVFEQLLAEASSK